MGRIDQIILGSVILGLGLTLASRGAASASETGELKVAIHEWDVPTKDRKARSTDRGGDGIQDP